MASGAGRGSQPGLRQYLGRMGSTVRAAVKTKPGLEGQLSAALGADQTSLDPHFRQNLARSGFSVVAARTLHLNPPICVAVCARLSVQRHLAFRASLRHDKRVTVATEARCPWFWPRAKNPYSIIEQMNRFVNYCLQATYLTYSCGHLISAGPARSWHPAPSSLLVHRPPGLLARAMIGSWRHGGSRSCLSSTTDRPEIASARSAPGTGQAKPSPVGCGTVRPYVVEYLGGAQTARLSD